MSRLLSNIKDTDEVPVFGQNSDAIAFTATMLATAALIKNQGFSLALRFYPSGGAGLNIYKYCNKKSKPLRRYALDFHPIWNKELKEKVYQLHYHRGESYNEIRKHRPYQGGW
jgi:hypothetical protein